MPELPEVENVRLSLLPLIQGKTITAIGTNWEKILTGGLAHFQQTLVGHTVTGLDRRGKYLLFRFDHGVTMVSHLRMEGKYQVVRIPPCRLGVSPMCGSPLATTASCAITTCASLGACS